MRLRQMVRLLRRVEGGLTAPELVAALAEDGPLRAHRDTSGGGVLYTLSWGDLQGASSRRWEDALESILDLIVREVASASCRWLIVAVVETLGPALLALLLVDDGAS